MNNWWNSEAIQKRELLENRRWYEGAEDRLEYFFKNEYNIFTQGQLNPYDIIDQQQKFWRMVGGRVPRVHSGLPKLATKTKVNLLTANGFDIEGEEHQGEDRSADDSDCFIFHCDYSFTVFAHQYGINQLSDLFHFHNRINVCFFCMEQSQCGFVEEDGFPFGIQKNQCFTDIICKGQEFLFLAVQFFNLTVNLLILVMNACQ